MYYLKHVTSKESCSLHSMLDIGDSTGAKQDLLTKYTLKSGASVLANKNETWSAFAEGLNDNEKCKIHNCRIKSNLLGKFLLESFDGFYSMEVEQQQISMETRLPRINLL